MARRLTPQGERQAAAVAQWLQAHLPERYTVVASPAVRAQQTAAALGATIVTDETLAPGASVSEIVKAAEKAQRRGADDRRASARSWGRRGQAGGECRRPSGHIEKGAIWWLVGDAPARIKVVLPPEAL